MQGDTKPMLTNDDVRRIVADALITGPDRYTDGQADIAVNDWIARLSANANNRCRNKAIRRLRCRAGLIRRFATDDERKPLAEPGLSVWTALLDSANDLKEHL